MVIISDNRCMIIIIEYGYMVITEYGFMAITWFITGHDSSLLRKYLHFDVTLEYYTNELTLLTL